VLFQLFHGVFDRLLNTCVEEYCSDRSCESHLCVARLFRSPDPQRPPGPRWPLLSVCLQWGLWGRRVATIRTQWPLTWPYTHTHTLEHQLLLSLSARVTDQRLILTTHTKPTQTHTHIWPKVTKSLNAWMNTVFLFVLTLPFKTLEAGC